MKKFFTPAYPIAVDLLVLSCSFSFYRVAAPSFSEKIFEVYATPVVYVTDLFAVIVIVLGITKLAIGGKPAFHPGKLKFHFIPISGIVLLSSISIFDALVKPLAIYYALRLLLSYVLLIILTSNPFDFKRVARVFFFGMLFQATIGIAQFVNRGPLGIPGEMALELSQTGAARINVAGIQVLRAYGLTFHPNVLGGFLMIGLLLGLPLTKQATFRIMWHLVFAGAIVSFSRSAWLAAVIVFPFLLTWITLEHQEYRHPLSKILLGILSFCILAIVLLPGQITTRLQPLKTQAERASIYERGQLIDIALSILHEDPLTGVGVGNFPLAVLKSRSSATPHFVHNVPLLIASECGIPAGLLWYTVWLAPFVRWNCFWKCRDAWPMVYGCGWFAMGIIGLWDSYPWNIESGRILSMILLAGVFISISANSEDETNY